MLYMESRSATQQIEECWKTLNYFLHEIVCFTECRNFMVQIYNRLGEISGPRGDVKYFCRVFRTFHSYVYFVLAVNYWIFEI